MSKSIDGPGFFIISDVLSYELGILDQVLGSDPVISNIIFVFSEREPVPEYYLSALKKHNKRLVIVPFEEYNKIDYASEVESLDPSRTVMVIKGLRHMLKRLDQRLSMMQIKHVCYKKIVTDRFPYVGAVWKYYFPFSFFDKSLLGYSHSYAFEADISNYKEGRKDEDPSDPYLLAQRTKDRVFTSYGRLFNFRVEVEEYKVSDSERQEYQRYRDSLFESEKSITRVISLLHQYSASLMPGHWVPANLKCLYSKLDEDSVVVRKTDLKVDDYLYSEMASLINNSNILMDHLHGS